MTTASTVRVKGPLLREFRKAALVERGELASRVGISPQRVSAIELDQKPNLRLGKFRTLCDVLELTDEQRRDLVAEQAA